MKNVLVILVNIANLLYMIQSSKIIPIKSVKTQYSYNAREFPPFNIVNGTDYWKSIQLCKACTNKQIDLILELNVESLIYSLQLEFSYPPTKLYVFGSKNLFNWIPLNEVSYTSYFTKFTKNGIDFNNPIKYIKLLMYNEIDTPLSVLMTRATIYSNDNNPYLIRKIYMNNGQIKHYCLKELETDDKSLNILGLEECYYCMMYYVKSCSFDYDNTDEIGHKFRIGGTQKYFYIPKELDTSKNKVSFLSIENEELDYSKDILNISTNSTMMDTYKINNIFTSSLDYWSSKLYKKGSCPVVEIKILFDRVMVVKTILIDWVKVPYSFSIKFCYDKEQSNCFSKEYSKDSIENFHSEIRKLYVKTNTMTISLYPLNSRVEGSSLNFCIFSIKQLRIFRNEIHVEPETITKDGKTSFVYNYNFFLTRLQSTNLEKVQSSNNLEMFEKTQTIINNIQKHKENINLSLDHKGFKELISYDLNKYNTFTILRDKLQKLLLYFDLESKENKKLLSGLDKKKTFELHKNITNITHYITNQVVAQNYYDTVSKFINYLQTFDTREIDLRMKSLNELLLDLDKLLIDNSYKFVDSLNDKYKLDTLKKIQKLAEIVNDSKNLRNILKLKTYFEKINKSFIEASLFSITDVKRIIETIKSNFDDLYENSKDEMSKFFVKLYIKLQNIKITNTLLKPFYIEVAGKNSLDKVCQKFNIINNFYIDNFLLKMILTYKHNTLNVENIIIIKFVNRFLFYYLKITWKKLELWKKTIDDDTMIISVNLESEKDKESSMKTFVKNLYFSVRIEDSYLYIKLKKDFLPLPKKIDEFLDQFKDIDFEKMFKFINSSENSYYDFFESKKKKKNIVNLKESDFRYSGYLAFNNNSTESNFRNMVIIGLSRTVPPTKPKEEVKYFKSIETSSKDKTFDDATQLKQTNLTTYFSRKLKLKKGDYYIFKTGFSVISDCYINFDVDFEYLTNKRFFFILTTNYGKKKSIIFELVKLTDFFQLKVMSLSGSRGANLYKASYNYKKARSKTVYTISISKSYESLRFNINGVKDADIYFNFKGYIYLEFDFIMSSDFKDTLKFLYLSDTKSLLDQIKERDFKDSKDSKMTKASDKGLLSQSNCSFERFNKYKTYKCNLFDNNICKIMYCKECCTKKLKQKDYQRYKSCYDSCFKINIEKIEM